jgi:DNA-binding IclR family transcriptional regulator
MHVVESVRTAIAILRFLASQPKSYGVNAIARELGVSPSSCFNIVKTLVLEGLLEFDERDKSYSPGLALAALAPRMNSDADLFRRVEADFEEIATRFSCTASLWRHTGGRMILIDSVRGAATMNVHMNSGLRLPALLGAMGRCVAAHSTWNRTRIEAAFREINWQKAPSFRSFMKEAVEAKKLGWAIDIDNYMLGLTTVAAPVLDTTGDIRFCIANIVLSGSRPHSELEKLGTATAALGRALSTKLFVARSS